eukprot:ANDGO_03021.mRNA.1 hypothetical protein
MIDGTATANSSDSLAATSPIFSSEGPIPGDTGEDASSMNRSLSDSEFLRRRLFAPLRSTSFDGSFPVFSPTFSSMTQTLGANSRFQHLWRSSVLSAYACANPLRHPDLLPGAQSSLHGGSGGGSSNSAFSFSPSLGLSQQLTIMILEKMNPFKFPWILPDLNPMVDPLVASEIAEILSPHRTAWAFQKSMYFDFLIRCPHLVTREMIGHIRRLSNAWASSSAIQETFFVSPWDSVQRDREGYETFSRCCMWMQSFPFPCAVFGHHNSLMCFNCPFAQAVSGVFTEAELRTPGFQASSVANEQSLRRVMETLFATHYYTSAESYPFRGEAVGIPHFLFRSSGSESRCNMYAIGMLDIVDSSCKSTGAKLMFFVPYDS